MAIPAPLRVLIVDDSPFMRTVLRQIVGSEPGFVVAGEAADGNAALAGIRDLRPDIVTLDLEMPGPDGIEVLRRTVPQAGKPPVFIMVSAFTTAGATQTLAALQAGALDFVPKASEHFQVDLVQVGSQVRQKLAVAGASLGSAPGRPRIPAPPPRTAARTTPGVTEPAPARVRPEPKGPAATVTVPGSAGAPPTGAAGNGTVAKPVPRTIGAAVPGATMFASAAAPDLVVVASSTGGPQTLPLLLGPLLLGPVSGYPAPIVVAQHIPPLFSRSLAESLSQSLGIRCQEAEPDQRLEPGTVYLLAGGSDAEVARGAGGGFVVRPRPTDGSLYHPNADLLFRSAALTARRPVGVVLTGMGTDGRDGARALVQRGRPVLVQDPAEAVLWGMPQAAIDAGAASEILSIADLARRLASMAGRSDGR